MRATYIERTGPPASTRVGDLPLKPFDARDLSLLGFNISSAPPDEQRVCAEATDRWAAEGKVRPSPAGGSHSPRRLRPRGSRRTARSAGAAA